MWRILAALTAFLLLATSPEAQETPVQDLLAQNRDLISESSRRTIGPAIDAIAESGLPEAQVVLQKWQNREMWLRESDGMFFWAEEIDRDTLRIFDFDTGDDLGEVPDDDFDQIKPNSGIRALIGAALVRFQLTDPNPARRRDALQAIERDAEAAHLEPLRASIPDEPDPAIRAKKERLERLLTISFDAYEAARLEAIGDVSGDISLDVRGTLNPLLQTRRKVVEGEIPGTDNVARQLTPGSDALPRAEAYAMLVDADMAPARVSDADLMNALTANIDGALVGGVPVAQLNTIEARERAYRALMAEDIVPPFVSEEEIDTALSTHTFYDSYLERSTAVTDAAEDAMTAITRNVGASQAIDLTLDALSLASIFFLAAIGLAITFGVMGVINMAHGEFIMMGAYTGYVVQQVIPNYTVSILVALPLAFAVTFAAGVAMERLVIRWLYDRPLETLLATFGISIALQQIAKNIFGTQARPLTSPEWLDGALVINDVIGISYIRIAIFVLALIFLCIFLFIMKKTRLGLETRAVTQNPRMAASMGINPDKVNMLTFGLGSGIAGIAGVAIGLFAKVTSELGQDYIVQSFMTVVVGGVGNIWGTLAGATMIGFFQKGVEWLNPSNTLAAQTYMIVFIIIFIQFRPRGIIALKGRAAGD
ncbi:urea ABC transporter permease subunit UrtB [Phaeobacter sp. 22II1-1F12B]|uniref:urea ABC transporter permease subunit UrtB n=1 Tax=Phaeobacter sp. 22II1-1F12B TaxID=1317111 RepID=UPI000B51E8B6|nr:urea ABC transporter permease subunit UrtB [Phaeobacter sp. 22II1-1F12B]OWU79226.1 branched-chain amino acid ABC transporter permease [Phaeobacter sp. 22II1-1F12B]